MNTHLAYIVCSLLAVLTVCGADSNTTEKKCVFSYKEFEKKTFIDNEDNTQRLYKVFYPPNGHLPYSVEVTYQTVLPNGTQVDVITQGVEVWMWLSSPIFLQAKPEILNRYTLFTLYHFRDWKPPKVDIQLPYPCQNVTFQFLLQMTASLKDYSLGELKRKILSGNVIAKSPKEGVDYQLPSEISNGTLSDRNSKNHNVFTIALGVGFLCQAILVWVVIVIAVKSKIKEYINNSKTYSFQFYGYPCGLTIVAILICAVTVIINIPHFTKGPKQTLNSYVIYISVMLVTGVWVLPGMPIAAYFTYKNKPPPVPYIIMIPVTLLFCCCNSKRAKSLVFGVALWINMIAAQAISFTATILILTAIVEPFAIITNTLVLVLGTFCVVNILALLFTTSAYLFTPRHKRLQGEGATIKRGVLLIPLLTAIICFCVVFTGNAYMINEDTKEGDITAVVGPAIVPIIIGAVTIGLKKLINKILEGPKEKADETAAELNTRLATEIDAIPQTPDDEMLHI